MKIFIKILFISLLIFNQASAEETVKKEGWDQQKAIHAIANQNIAKLKKYIKVATTKELNEIITINYRGEYSFLNLVIDSLTDESKTKEIIGLLLQKGVETKSISKDGISALAQAINMGKWEIVDFLLKSGISCNIEIQSKYSQEKLPLFYTALKQQNRPLIDLLLPYKPKVYYIEGMKQQNPSYLTQALRANEVSFSVIKYLLESGEKADEIDLYTKLTPYEGFLKNRNLFESRDDKKKTQKHLDVLNLLLSHGLNPIVHTQRDCLSPLLIVNNDGKTLAWLLEKGLDPNTIACYRSTNLSIPIVLGELETFKTLLNRGGNLFISKNNIEINPFFKIMSTKNAKNILQWLFENKKTIFENISEKDAMIYLKKLITSHDDGSFQDIINFFLKSSKNYEATINELLLLAVKAKKIKKADSFFSLGAKLVESKCNCSQPFWNKDLDDSMINWLIKNNVTPYDGEKAVSKVVDFTKVSLAQFDSILKMSSAEGNQTKIVNEIFMLLLDSYTLSNNLLLNEEKVTLLKKYGLEIAKVKTQKNELFLPLVVKDYLKKERYINIIWLLKQGARISKENQEHYVESTYMRALIDRAGVGRKEIDFTAQTKEERESLKEIFSNYLNDKWYLKHKKLFLKPEGMNTVASALSKNETLKKNASTSYLTLEQLQNQIRGYHSAEEKLKLFPSIKRLMEKGFSPVESVSDSFSFMKELSFADNGTLLYNKIYNELSFYQKVINLDVSLLNTVINYKKGTLDDKRYIFFTLLISSLVLFLVLFISFVFYLINERKLPSKKQTKLSLWLKIPFLLGIMFWVLLLINALSLDYYYLERMKDLNNDLNFILMEWDSWLFFYLFILIGEFISLVFIFRKSFTEKYYHNLIFYGFLLIFILSLLFPFLIIVFSELHDGYLLSYVKGGLL